MRRPNTYLHEGDKGVEGLPLDGVLNGHHSRLSTLRVSHQRRLNLRGAVATVGESVVAVDGWCGGRRAPACRLMSHMELLSVEVLKCVCYPHDQMIL